MNFIDTMASVELVLAANQVPLLVGETGIGKTSLAARVADVHDWELVTIDGNLLKEGEIGGLPTVETVGSVLRHAMKEPIAIMTVPIRAAIL